MRRILAEVWSLNGKSTRAGSGSLKSLGEGAACSAALMAIKRVIVEFISLSGCLRPENNNSRRSHSSEK